MTSYDAGKSRATYELDSSAFFQEVARIKRAYAELRGLGQQAAAGAQTVVPRSEAPNARDVTPRLRDQATATQRAQRETLALAQAEARLLQAQGNLPGAIGRINTALAGTTQETRQVIQVRTQLARLEAQQARQARPTPSGGLGASLGGIGRAAGAVGIGLGVAELTQGAIAAGRYATGLTQTENVLRQLAGSQQRYNTLTRIAAENQKLFGGTLAENYAPLTGVLALSNQTGASLEQLNSVTQLLLAKAPGKSAGDAFFGLGEFLSGQGAEAALSLADQFNLSKQAIAALAQEGVSAEQRLQGLTRLLAEQGVTAATLEARLTDEALAYNRLGAAGEQAFIRLGNAANRVGVPIANALGGAVEGLLRLRDTERGVSFENIGRGTQRLFGFAGGWQAAAQAAQQAGTTLRGAAQQGEDAAAAREREAQRTRAGFDAIGQVAQNADPKVATLENRLLTLAAAGGGVQDGAFNLALAWAAGGLSAEQLAAQIANLEGQQQRIAAAQEAADSASQRSAVSMDLAAAAASSQKRALDEATAAAAAQANAGGTMEAQARAAAAALLAAGQAGATAAARLAGSTNLVDQMTAALYRLQRAQQPDAQAALMGYDAAQLRRTQEQTRALNYQRDVQEGITRVTGTTAQRLAQVNAELANAPKYSDDAKRLEIERAQLTQQLANEQQAAADKRASQAESAASKAASEAKAAADKARREREQRQEEVDRAYQQIEDRTADHYRRLRQAQEDYQLSASRREEDYQIERQRLLAEGRIKEAQLLEQRYQLEQRRAAEDAARARSRQTEDYGGDVAKIREDARLTGVQAAQARAAVPTVPAAAVAASQQAAQATAILAATAVQRPGPLQIQVQIAPTQVVADGVTLATVVWPTIEQLVDLELSNGIAQISVVAPPGAGQPSGVSGPRP